MCQYIKQSLSNILLSSRLSIFTLLLLIISTETKAQDINHLLGLPADSIIALENTSMGHYGQGKSMELVSAQNIIGSGFKLNYRTGVFYDNAWHYNSTIFIFDIRDRLCSIITTFPGKGELEQINLFLSGDYYKVSDQILYHKTQDLKIVITNDKDTAGNNEAVFSYSRKDYKNPDQ